MFTELFTAVIIIYNNQDLETSTHGWMDKEYAYKCNGISLSHKKEWNLAIFNNIDGPREHYAKWNKSDRERQILYDFTYRWTLRNKTKEQTFKWSHRYRGQAGCCWGGGGEK